MDLTWAVADCGLGAFSTATLCSAHEGVTAMRADIQALHAGTRLFGRARTARVSPGQNMAIHRAVLAAQSGEVLVVDGGASRSFGPFGDILGAACLKKRIAGLVIDSTVRDGDGLRELGFPVFCLGVHPAATAKSEEGEIDIEVSCGGVSVRPGDFIAADADGVVVIRNEAAAEVAERAQAVVDNEQRWLRAIEGGASTLEALGLGPRESNDEKGVNR